MAFFWQKIGVKVHRFLTFFGRFFHDHLVCKKDQEGAEKL